MSSDPRSRDRMIGAESLKASKSPAGARRRETFACARMGVPLKSPGSRRPSIQGERDGVVWRWPLRAYRRQAVHSVWIVEPCDQAESLFGGQRRNG